VLFPYVASHLRIGQAIDGALLRGQMGVLLQLFPFLVPWYTRTANQVHASRS
jgi:hypothetical protein